MNQRAYGRGPLHGVRQPRVQRELAGLANRAREYAGGYPRRRAARDYPRLDPRVQVGNVQPVQPGGGQRVLLREQIQYAEQESEIAYARYDKRLLRGGGGGRARVPEPYQQIRAEPHELPEHEYLYYPRRQHKPDHRGGEQRHIGVVARERSVVFLAHVAERVYLHHQANAGDDDEHYRGERIHEDADVHLELPDRQPAVQPIRDFAMPANRLRERHERQDERQPDRADGQPAGGRPKRVPRGAPRRARVCEGPNYQPNRSRRRERREQYQPCHRFGHARASSVFRPPRVPSLWERKS